MTQRKFNDRVLKLIDKVLAVDAKAIFGGSVALFALGLLNRQPKDVDLAGDIKQFKRVAKKFGSMYGPDSYPEHRGHLDYDRRPLNISGGTMQGDSCFFVYAKTVKGYAVEISGRKIYVQDPMQIIAAKHVWSKQNNEHGKKHTVDLQEITEQLVGRA